MKLKNIWKKIKSFLINCLPEIFGGIFFALTIYFIKRDMGDKQKQKKLEKDKEKTTKNISKLKQKKNEIEKNINNLEDKKSRQEEEIQDYNKKLKNEIEQQDTIIEKIARRNKLEK